MQTEARLALTLGALWLGCDDDEDEEEDDVVDMIDVEEELWSMATLSGGLPSMEEAR